MSLGLAPIADIIGAPAWAQRPPAHRRTQDGPYWPKYDRARGIRARRRPPLLGRVRRPAARPLLAWSGTSRTSARTSLPQPWTAGSSRPAGTARWSTRSPTRCTPCAATTSWSPAGSRRTGRRTRRSNATSPLLFMRALLCLSDGPKPKRDLLEAGRRSTSGRTIPYTSGGPTREAGRRTTSSLGDLDRDGGRAPRGGARRDIRSSGRVRFWVTEFSWDTSPPDPKGVPMELHARWVAEALYRMWRDGVSARDVVPRPGRAVPRRARPSPASSSAGASGPASDTPKPSTAGVPLPVRRASGRRGGRVRVLGPHADERGGHRRSSSARCRAAGDELARVRAGSSGIFTGTLRRDRAGPARSGRGSPAASVRCRSPSACRPTGTCARSARAESRRLDARRR